ncbi:MAG: ZIP family metal transporter [Thermoleophilia bacterium]
MLLFWIILFSLIGSVGAVLLSATFLLFPTRTHKVLLPFLVSYASGTLLAVALLDLIPETLDEISPTRALSTVLAGIVAFFILEKLVIWRHCHRDECEVHSAAGSLILFGDAFHNFVDGVVIGAAFITSVPLGMATSLAIVSHEIPQEVGDFAILMDSGYSRQRALAYNTISGLSTLPAALLAYYYLPHFEGSLPYVVLVAAASFIYISVADLFPNLHTYTQLRQTIYQLVSMLAGIGTIVLLHAGH